MVGLHPLHFVVNITTLVLEMYFSDTDFKITMQILNYKKIVLIAILTGLANLILFILFFYPNFFFVALRLTAKKRSSIFCVCKIWECGPTRPNPKSLLKFIKSIKRAYKGQNTKIF